MTSPRSTASLLLLVSLAVVPAAQAAPYVAPASPPEPLDFAATAKEIVVVPKHTGEYPLGQQPRPQHLGAKILYVNFDGGNLGYCGSDSPQGNCSSIYDGTVLPFSGNESVRAGVIQSIRQRVADFGITVTDQRPGSGDYDMEMVGDWQGQSPGFAGIAPGGDCWDNNGGEISFTLEVTTSPDGVAEIVLQELAHTWGLDHVDEVQDLLYPTTEGQNKTFRDDCYQIVEDTDLNPGQGWCDHHADACGSYSQQNSHAELMMIFGPSQPDTVAPNMAILAPGHGDTIEGGDFELVIGIQDDQSPAVIDLAITISGGSLAEPLEAGGAFVSPNDGLAFPIVDLPDGIYTITVDATDESDNPTSDEIQIQITGSDAPPGDGGGEAGEAGSGEAGGDAGTDGEGGGEADGTEGGDAGDSAPTTVGTAGGTGEPRGENEGCTCTSDAPARASLAWFLAVPLILGGRRRRRATR
jgi:hypothetical protein